MSLTFSLQSLKLSSPFHHGTTSPLSPLTKPASSLSSRPKFTPNFLTPIRAMKSMQGRVVCNSADKTVSVEVMRLAPHPKYKRRIRIKKKFQAHDPENKFKVGDIVQLQKCKPISKTKAFLAIPAPVFVRNDKKEGSGQLGIPLESQQQA